MDGLVDAKDILSGILSDLFKELRDQLLLLNEFNVRQSEDESETEREREVEHFSRNNVLRTPQLETEKRHSETSAIPIAYSANFSLSN